MFCKIYGSLFTMGGRRERVYFSPLSEYIYPLGMFYLHPLYWYVNPFFPFIPQSSFQGFIHYVLSISTIFLDITRLSSLLRFSGSQPFREAGGCYPSLQTLYLISIHYIFGFYQSILFFEVFWITAFLKEVFWITAFLKARVTTTAATVHDILSKFTIFLDF